MGWVKGGITIHHTHEIIYWIERLQRNEPDAFEGLYKKCSAYVSFVCHKFCDSKEDAEEIVQDTFVIAFKKADQLRSETLLAYLRKIAVHECFRRRKANHQRLTKFAGAEELPDDLPELDKALLPEAALMDKELQRRLLIEVSKLPKNQREMVYLYYYMDYAVVQIAELMQCSANSVYLVLQRARKSIKRKLEKERTTLVAAHAWALLPLAVLFVAEEASYVALYVPVAYAGAGATALAATAVAGSGSVVGYVTAACAVVVLFAAANVYVTLSATQEPPPVYEPLVIVEATEPPVTSPPMPVITPTPTPPPTLPPAQPETTAPTPIPTSAPTLPPPTPAPTLPPVPVNRTQDLLAALSQTHTPQVLAHILDYYGFGTVINLSSFVGGQYNFFLFNEGDGDVLVGTATYADGNGWRMQYKFVEGGTAETDTIELFAWMNH